MLFDVQDGRRTGATGSRAGGRGGCRTDRHEPCGAGAANRFDVRSSRGPRCIGRSQSRVRIRSASSAAGAVAVGFQPVITTLPEGTNFAATAVISADRRYVRITAPALVFGHRRRANLQFFYGRGDDAARDTRRWQHPGWQSHRWQPGCWRRPKLTTRGIRLTITERRELARPNVQIERFGQAGLEPFQGDRAHHGVVGAELQRRDEQPKAVPLRSPLPTAGENARWPPRRRRRTACSSPCVPAPSSALPTRQSTTAS